jgi:hypothetical protein
MPSLTPLTVGNAAAPSGWNSAPNGALGDNSDATFGNRSTNGTTTGVDQGWELGDVDADLDNVDTLAIVLRYGWSATPVNSTWPLLAARVMSGATVLAAADSGGTFETVATDITDTSPTNSSSIPFTYVDTGATKAQWNAAVVEIRISRVRTAGGGAQTQNVYEADLTGTYTAAGAETNANAEVATGTGAANPDTAKVTANLAVALATAATAAGWAGIGPSGLTSATATAHDATADTGGAVTFNAEAAVATAAAIVAGASLAASAGYARGRST